MKPTLAYVENLARQAGAILRAGYDQEHQVDYKGIIDLVTEVDHQSEEFLLGEVRRDFSDHHIFSEESGIIQGNTEHIWFIDPIDGTVNYAHGTSRTQGKETSIGSRLRAVGVTMRRPRCAGLFATAPGSLLPPRCRRRQIAVVDRVRDLPGAPYPLEDHRVLAGVVHRGRCRGRQGLAVGADVVARVARGVGLEVLDRELIDLRGGELLLVVLLQRRAPLYHRPVGRHLDRVVGVEGHDPLGVADRKSVV